MEFNYQKAYFVLALPAFNNLSKKAKKVHAQLIDLVGPLRQEAHPGSKLLIPMSKEIESLIDSLATREIAELSRASYYLGHWAPGNILPFDNKQGASWKITDCCDQVLRKRLSPKGRISIHEGKLRITYTSRHSWMWEEVCLATEDNLQTIYNSGLAFDEENLSLSCKQLAKKIRDLWPDVNDVEDSMEYILYKKQQHLISIKASIEDSKEKIQRLKEELEREEETLKTLEEAICTLIQET